MKEDTMFWIAWGWTLVLFVYTSIHFFNERWLLKHGWTLMSAWILTNCFVWCLVIVKNEHANRKPRRAS